MSMMRFGQFFRDLAERETRCVTLTAPLLQEGRLILPADEYGLDESYCVEAGCDCRRVMINVLARYARDHVATINHGFDPPSRDYDLSDQTFLDPLNRQTEWSEALLDVFVNVVLRDKAYQKRLLLHYHMFKNAVNDQAHPCQRFIRGAEVETTMESAVRRSPIPPPPRRGKRKWR